MSQAHGEVREVRVSHTAGNAAAASDFGEAQAELEQRCKVVRHGQARLKSISKIEHMHLEGDARCKLGWVASEREQAQSKEAMYTALNIYAASS